MKAYCVYKLAWRKQPIEEIEVDRITEKSYFIGRARRSIDCDRHRVFVDIDEAIKFARELYEILLSAVAKEESNIRDRLFRIDEFSKEHSSKG